MISSKHISKIAWVLISVILILCVLSMVFSNKLFPEADKAVYGIEYESNLFDTDSVADINIIMDEESWREMLENAIQETYFRCDVSVNGQMFYNVGIRPKGNTSLSSIAHDHDNNRYSFKLEFDRFVDGQSCFGLDKLILNNSYADNTYMKEAIVYDMFQYLDADASLYNYAKISVNNEYFGIYLALEAVEDSFMRRNYGAEKGFLYKPENMPGGGNKNGKKGGNGLPQPPPMVDGKFPEPPAGMNGQLPSPPPMVDGKFPEPPAGMNGQMPSHPQGMDNPGGKGGPGGRPGGGPGGFGGGSNLNYTDDQLDSYATIWSGSVNGSSNADNKRVVAALKNISERTNIESSINVDNILKYMAVHNFSVNKDSLSGHMAHNYYLYESGGMINIIPWDYNLSFGGMYGGSGTSVINDPIDDSYASTKLFDFVLEDEEYKDRYHEYYTKLVDEYLYGGGFEQTYQRIRNQIDELVKTDPNTMCSYDEYLVGVEIFHEAVMLRAESIRGQLNGTIPSTSVGQSDDSSVLVDASHINVYDMGSFSMGGRPGGPGGRGNAPGENDRGNGMPQMPGEQQAAYNADMPSPEQNQPVGENSDVAENPPSPPGGDGGFGMGRMPDGNRGDMNPAQSSAGNRMSGFGEFVRYNALTLISVLLLILGFIFVVFCIPRQY